MDAILQLIYTNIIDGEPELVVQNVSAALAQGMPSEEILNNSLIPAMAEVGHRYENGDYYIPEMLLSAHAMKDGLDIIRPNLVSKGFPYAGKVLIGTIKGDLHDIGKNLVGIMLKGAGFEVIDIGVDVAPERFVQEALAHQPDVIAISALLTTTMGNMETAIQLLAKSNLSKKAFVIVGGAPISAEFAQQIGADGFAPDASQGVNLVKKLLNIHYI